MSADWLDDDRVTAVLDDAALVYVAVTGRHDPHVTPLAYEQRGRDLWVLTPRHSAKVRGIERDSRVGVLVRYRGRSVVGAGHAQIVDPLKGRGLSSLLKPDLPFTALGYLARNDRRVLGTVLDGPSPTLPLTRASIRITLTRVALVDARGVRASWGDWPSPSVLLDGSLDGRPPSLDGVPTRSLLADGATAALGWQTADGPVALPARWSASGIATVPPGALELAGALAAAPACLTVQRSSNRISSVRGVLLSGHGRSRVTADGTAVAVDADRVTWWSGEDSGTVHRLSDTPSGQSA